MRVKVAGALAGWMCAFAVPAAHAADDLDATASPDAISAAIDNADQQPQEAVVKCSAVHLL
jgi:hypothetical protein